MKVQFTLYFHAFPLGCTSVCTSVCIYIYIYKLYVHPPVYYPVCPPARLSTCPPARLPACPPARLPACPPARQPACPPAHRLFRSPDYLPDRPCACPRSLCLCSRSVYRSVRPVTYQFSRLPTQYPASRWPAGQIPRQLLISSPLRCSNPNP